MAPSGEIWLIYSCPSESFQWHFEEDTLSTSDTRVHGIYSQRAD